MKFPWHLLLHPAPVRGCSVGHRFPPPGRPPSRSSAVLFLYAPGRPRPATRRPSCGGLHRLAVPSFSRCGPTWASPVTSGASRRPGPPHLLTPRTAVVIGLVIFHSTPHVSRAARGSCSGASACSCRRPIDILTTASTLYITSDPRHACCFGDAVMLAGAIRGCGATLRPAASATCFAGLWLFFVENALFPTTQEYGVLSLGPHSGRTTADELLTSPRRGQSPEMSCCRCLLGARHG